MIYLSLVLFIIAGAVPAFSFDVAEVLTPNILLNPRFDTENTDNWLPGHNGALSVTDEYFVSPPYSMKISPDLFLWMGVSQALPINRIIDQDVTISGCMRSTGDRKLLVMVAMFRSSGYDTTCVQLFPGSPGEWSEVTLECSIPDDTYYAAIVFTAMGTYGSLFLDDLEFLPHDPPPGFVIEKFPAELTPIPESAALVAVSNRHHTPGVGGILNNEVYVLDVDGSNATRITWNGFGHIHPAVSPCRRYIAVSRFTEDIDGDLEYVVPMDPQALWILDLEAQEEWLLVPDYYYHSGIGGIVWSPDGEWIFFALNTGRNTSIHKIRPDGTGLTRVSRDNHLSSDPGISADGEWIVYHREERYPDGSRADKAEIWAMRTDGSGNRRISDGGSESGHQGGWVLGDWDPEPNPDGSCIFVGYKRPHDKGFDLVRVDIPGGARTTLVSGAFNRLCGIPDWCDGEVIFTEWKYSLFGQPQYVGIAAVQPEGGGFRRLEGPFEDPLDGCKCVRVIRSPR